MENIANAFTELGGEFIASCMTLEDRLPSVKAFLFDWDGVFNEGVKGPQSPSPYSEAASMGLNLLRFGYWLQNDGQLPFVAVVTGQRNDSAFQLAARERFDAVYFKFSDKRKALRHMHGHYGIEPDETAFTFDDALDLSAAAQCRIRMLVRRTSSPLFSRYVRQHKYADYVTAHSGGAHAVREVCELLLGLSGRFNEAMDKRIGWHEDYQAYLSQRQACQTQQYEYDNGAVNLSEGL